MKSVRSGKACEVFQTAEQAETETEAEIARLKRRRTFELKRLLVILRPSASQGHFRCFAHADLAKRLDLLISVPGKGGPDVSRLPLGWTQN